MIDTALYGSLTIGSLVAVVVFTCLAFVFVQRSLARPAAASGEEVGAAPAVLKKVRKREQLSDEEMAIAKHVIAKRRSLMAYSIPAAIFSIGASTCSAVSSSCTGPRPRSGPFSGHPHVHRPERDHSTTEKCAPERASTRAASTTATGAGR